MLTSHKGGCHLLYFVKKTVFSQSFEGEFANLSCGRVMQRLYDRFRR